MSSEPLALVGSGWIKPDWGRYVGRNVKELVRPAHGRGRSASERAEAGPNGALFFGPVKGCMSVFVNRRLIEHKKGQRGAYRGERRREGEKGLGMGQADGEADLAGD
jgi:hypothetical protein